MPAAPALVVDQADVRAAFEDLAAEVHGRRRELRFVCEALGILEAAA